MWRHGRIHTGLDTKGSHKAEAESVSNDLHIMECQNQHK